MHDRFRTAFFCEGAHRAEPPADLKDFIISEGASWAEELEDDDEIEEIDLEQVEHTSLTSPNGIDFDLSDCGEEVCDSD